MKKISVIIPMYNAKDTLEECLDSIFSQTIISDIEVIIIDDCSTDNSFEIATSYEQRAPENVALIHLDRNGGPGAAMNVGLSYASGEYIGFVGSDDAIVPEMYEKLYNEAIRTNADFVDSGLYKQQTDTAFLYTTPELSGILNDHKRSEMIIHGGYTVSRIIKRSLITKNNIVFREVYMLEDLDFLAEIIARSNIASYVEETFYIYRDSPESLSKKIDIPKYVKNYSEAIVGLYNRTSKLFNYPGIQDAVEFLIIRMYSYMINNCMNAVYLNEHDEQEIIPILNSLRALKNSTVSHGYDNPYVVKGISPKDLMIIKENDKSAQAVLALQGETKGSS
ncbi:glycosyltransferase family 2 protein [Butyrivibrio fibrisolvens]|uniref:glycosyltransferase family 2 protein n=1 Tax=Butyrivibrio fibrisolvens TaxID=831 RepID=UPI000400A942|nr:glycosyltransferase [Butyrivibrio fibrisolvens]